MSKTKNKKKFKAPTSGRSMSEMGPSTSPDEGRHAAKTSTSKITTMKAAFIIVAVGLATYFTGLANEFQGDDNTQIINNLPVHSLSNIQVFFQGGTFYSGHGLAPLDGIYFRPLMTTVFSLLYSLFGPNSIYYHIFQLALVIASTFLLFLLFRYSLKPMMALFLSLIFLVHPLNSQVAFAIPSMQDALFFFFGILALWLLLRYGSVKSLVAVVAALTLSLFSKEAGILFIALALLHLFLRNRQRLLPFIYISAIPIGFYIALKAHAVGLLVGNPHTAPIDKLGLAGRLITAPSIASLYIAKFIFPWKLASAYYFAYPSVTFSHFVLPLAVDLLALALFIYLGNRVRKTASKSQFNTYLFFSAWSALGLLAYSQIAPLDMTACETWIYFSLAGILGMLGIASTIIGARIRPKWVLVLGILLVTTLGVRSAIRAYDWRSADSIAYADIATSKEDYIAYNNLASSLAGQGKPREAEPYVQQSIKVYPFFGNYINQGVILGRLGDYPGAVDAYSKALKLNNNYALVYENLAALTLVYGDEASNKELIINALQRFPQDSKIWMYLAILEEKSGDNASAKAAITKAAAYGQVPPFIYNGIVNDTPFTIHFTDLNTTLVVQ